MKHLDRLNNFTSLSIIVTALSFFLYLITAVIFYKLNNFLVPSGDPFSYTISLFKLLDYSEKNYWNGIQYGIFNQQWYWLYKLPVAILAPLLAKEPYILCSTNYLFMAVGTISFARMALRLNLSFNSTLILTLSLWLYPWIYGYHTNFSLFNLMLETSFYWILIAFTANLIIYSLNPKSYKNGLIAGVFAGLAIWGRGNSLPYVIIILALPITAIAYRLFNSRSSKKSFLVPLTVFFASFMALALWYYSITFDELRAYYWDLAQDTTCDTDQGWGFLKFPTVTLAGIKLIAINFPGIIFTRDPSSFSNTPVTVIMHIIVLSSAVIMIRRWRKKPSRKNRLLATSSITGAVLFYGTLIMMILILAPSFGAGDGIIFHPFLMMLVGFVFSMFAFFADIAEKKAFSQWIAKPAVLSLALIFLLSYGYYFSKKLTPIDINSTTAQPNVVSNFAVNLEQIIGDKTLTLLWYGQAYNRFILDYYRIQNGVPEANFYTSHEEMSLFTTSYTDECAENIPIKEFRERLRKLMLKSEYIILPEDIRSFDFMMGQPGLANRRGELAAFLNSPNSPKYGVRMILHDYHETRLLLLKPLKFGKNPDKLDLLTLPYGKEGSSNPQLYPKAAKDNFVKKKNSRFGPRMLSDNSLASFWEIKGTYPHKVQMGFQKPKKLLGYKFKVGIHLPESITRMPTDWKLEGSTDGDQWAPLDVRSDQTQWRENGKETFIIQNPENYVYYRFVFLKGLDRSLIRMYEIDFLENDSDGGSQIVDTVEYDWTE